MPTECERSVTSSVTTKISSNEIKDNNSTITTTTTTTTSSSSISFNEDLQATSAAMMEGGDMSTSQTSTTSNGSSSCNGGGRKTSITSPDPTAYVAKARVTRPTPPPPPYNPMQFVQIKPCNLYQTAQEQLKKAEEVKKIKEIRKEEPEDWQNNLDNWKSSRRKRVEHIIDRVVEVKKLELEEHDRTRRKSKTFSEMIEERGERAGGRGLNKLVSLAVYAEDESNDLSDLGIGTSSASGKSSLSEDYDNNSVMSDNAAELDKAITNSTHHKPATDSTTREYISSPGYETSSSTAPASSPDPCEYTYEGAIQDYKQRVSRAASGLTTVALNKLTQHNQTQQNSKESTPERGVVKETSVVAAYPPRRGSKIEDRLMGFEVQSPSSEECVEKSKVVVPKIDISKRKEIFEQQQQQQQQQQQALQTNEPKSSSQSLGNQTNTVVVPRVTLRDRFKVQQQQDTHTETSVTQQPKKELKRLSGDITSIKERLQSLEQQQNLVNGAANGAIKATANKLVDIPVPPLKERLSSLQNAVTKEEIRKPPVVLIDARQLEIMKVEEEKAQQSLKETKEREKEKQSEAAATTQLQKETKIVTEEPEETDRDDSGIHTADDVELEEQQQQQRLQADQMMKKEQELKLNAAIEALAKEEQQLSEAANVVNQIEAEFEELTLASVATLPPLAGAANATTASSSSASVSASASASATPITNDHMEYSINEALELALAAIDKETIPLAATQQQPPPPQPQPQQLQPQPENLYPITAPSSNTYDNNNSSSSTTTATNNNNSNNSNNINNICNNNNNSNNNKHINLAKKQDEKQIVSAEDILLNKTDEEKYEKLNLEIKLEEKTEEEISQEPIYENIITNNSTTSNKEVDVALMMSTTTTTTATTLAYQQQQQQQQQKPQIIPSMIMMMHNTDDNNTDQHNNNNNVDNDNKSSPSNNHNNHNHNSNIIKALQIENQNSNQNLSTLTNAAASATVTVTTTALASKQLKNSQINKINNNNNNNNSNNINNIVVANDNNYNHNNNNTDNKTFNKQNLNDLTNAFANTTITTTTTTNNATTTQQHISTTTTTVNHKPNNNTNTNTTTSSSSSTIHLKELNFNQQTLMMTTAAVQQPSDLNKPEQQQQHLQQQQQQQHLNDDNNAKTLDLNISEPYYQVPKSNEPYYDAPKHLKPIPVYENIEVFFNGNSLSTDLNSHLQPPKEKPPPPPVDSPPLFDDVDSSSHTDTWSSDNTYETLTRHQNNHNHNHHQHLSPDHPSPPIKRMNSTKRIKKELRHKRSSFLGIEGSSLDDDESYLELTVAPPPDMAQLLQEERRLEKQLYLKAGLCDSSDTGESRDSGVSENHSRQSSEHYTNSSEENEPHDDTTSPLTLQTQTDTQPNDMIYQNDGLLAVVPTPLLQTVKGNSAESWTESATVAAAATQSLTEATATANAKMMSIEEKIREQEEVLRVERELLQLEQEELKRQRENLMLRENMARRELQHGAKMLMSANRRSLQDLNGLGAMTVVNIQNESQIPANGLEMYHHQMHQGLQAAQGQQHMMSQPQLAQPQQLQQANNKPQQIYANIPNLQQQYYHMETDYRKSMSDINEFSKRMMSQPPAPPSKPMRAMHTNTTSNANGVIHNVEQNDYAARQRHSLNTQNFGGSLVKIAAAPTAAPRTAAHIYSNYQHQSVQNLAPTSSTSHQQVLTTANQSLYPGNMSRNTLHALSATPKPKYTDGWVQVQQRKSYDSNLASDPAWLSAYQQKRKSMPDANYHGYNQNNHWLIQEAEQRRLNEQQHQQQQQQQQQQQRRTISSNNTPLHQMNNSNSIKMTNGSSTVLTTATATATTNGKPLPDSIIQTLTERVQSKGIGERKRTNLDKSPLHAASAYHHYQQQQQQYNKLNQTQQQFSSNTAIHRHNNVITTLSSTATASIATPSMAATTANGQSNITTITQQQHQQQQQHQHQQQQQQDKVLSVSGKKKCSHCGDELGRGAAMIIESLLLFYHINCFKCCVCHVQLGDGLNGTDVRVRNHKLHCQNCYSSDDGIKFSCV